MQYSIVFAWWICSTNACDYFGHCRFLRVYVRQDSGQLCGEPHWPHVSCDQPNKGVYLWKAAWKRPGGQCDFLEFGWIYSLDLHFPWAFGTLFLAQPKHHQIESNQLRMQANAVIFAVIQVFKVNAKQSSASLLNFSWGLCWWLCWLVSLQCLLPPSWSKDLLKPSRTSKPEKIH